MNLIVEFNEETGEDKVLGAQSVLDTGVVGKGYIEMEAGDEIKLLCDYFTYDGNFESQYVLGNRLQCRRTASLPSAIWNLRRLPTIRCFTQDV